MDCLAALCVPCCGDDAEELACSRRRQAEVERYHSSGAYDEAEASKRYTKSQEAYSDDEEGGGEDQVFFK
jgi:hypothetical protein